MKKVIILGGGVSGLVSATLLARQNNFEVLLVDKNESFLNVLRLHLTFQEPLQNFQKSFSSLASKFNFKFLQKEVIISSEDLLRWQKESFIDQINESFDYLIVSTGASQVSPESLSTSKDAIVLGLNDFISEKWKDNIFQLISSENISFVGGGASSIQFIFEMYAFLEKYKLKPKINFFTMEDRILSSLPKVFHDYIHSKFRNKNTYFYSNHKIKSITRENVLVESVKARTTEEFPSDITFFFPGVRPFPFQMETNEYGQFMHGSYIYQNIFASGDCSYFKSNGDNYMSAQIAVRKARIVSRNILNHSQNQSLSNFNYKELGYFISMGGLDGIGWMLAPMNVLFGPPAFVVKELIEKQLEFFITGLDTYIDF